MANLTPREFARRLGTIFLAGPGYWHMSPYVGSSSTAMWTERLLHKAVEMALPFGLDEDHFDALHAIVATLGHPENFDFVEAELSDLGPWLVVYIEVLRMQVYRGKPRDSSGPPMLNFPRSRGKPPMYNVPMQSTASDIGTALHRTLANKAVLIDGICLPESSALSPAFTAAMTAAVAKFAADFDKPMPTLRVTPAPVPCPGCVDKTGIAEHVSTFNCWLRVR